MKVLIACEFSGAVRDAFISRGHDAISCDLLPSESPGPHYQGNVTDILRQNWDMIIAHPPCTYLSSSGLHWNSRGKKVNGRPREELTLEALAFARIFIDGKETSHIPMRIVENPIGCISTYVRKPDQIIQPYQFGSDASKATCLWLHGVSNLIPTSYVRPRTVEYPIGSGLMKNRWGNQTDSGQNRLSPGPDRWKMRSNTFPGIAMAMAEQWG